MNAIPSLKGTYDCRSDSIDTIDRALAADRYGDIRAVIVKPDVADAARAIVERCWHDAAVIVEDAA